MIVDASELPDMLSACFEADLVPFVKGPPGIGKSMIVQQVADNYNLKLIDLRLSQADPTDMQGLPFIKPGEDKAGFMPMDTFPLEGDDLPAKPDGSLYDGWLVFLDELNSAPLSVQAAAFKVVLDRKIGQTKLHPNVCMAAAGNREIDKGIVNRMSTPMQSRLAHFELKVEQPAWMEWAAKAKLDYRIISFIGFKAEALNNFDPTHNKDTYACPRTWEFASRLAKKLPVIEVKHIPLFAAVIDEAMAHEFFTYSEIFKNLVTIPQIERAPTTTQVPEEASILYALSGTLGENISTLNAVNLMQFIERMPPEFQILSMQNGIMRDPSISSIKPIRDWTIKMARDLF